MNFQDFLVQIQSLEIKERRAQTAEYFEAVISKAGLDSLHKNLRTYFGPPLKAEGHFSSGKARRHAKPYGGVRRNQTMYFRRDGDYDECALLWPWGSGACVTLKVIRSKNAGSWIIWKEFICKFLTRLKPS